MAINGQGQKLKKLNSPRADRVTIGDAIKLTGVSRNTLKLHFRNLVEHGHLIASGVIMLQKWHQAPRQILVEQQFHWTLYE